MVYLITPIIVKGEKCPHPPIIVTIWRAPHFWETHFKVARNFPVNLVKLEHFGPPIFQCV